MEHVALHASTKPYFWLKTHPINGVYNGIWQNKLEGVDFHVAWYAFVLKIWHFRTKSLIQIFSSKSQSRASFWWFDRFQLFVVLKIWQNRTDLGLNLSNYQNDEPKWLTWRFFYSITVDFGLRHITSTEFYMEKGDTLMCANPKLNVRLMCLNPKPTVILWCVTPL